VFFTPIKTWHFNPKNRKSPAVHQSLHDEAASNSDPIEAQAHVLLENLASPAALSDYITDSSIEIL
jgi:hypothetical protein